MCIRMIEEYKVASDKKLLYPYASFSAALLAYLRLLWKIQTIVDDELSHDAFENAVQGFSANVKTSLPAINDQVFRDFSEFMVTNDADKKDFELLGKLVQLYIDLQFAQMCLNEFMREGPDVSFEEFLVDKVIKMMLDKFVRKGRATRNVLTPSHWIQWLGNIFINIFSQKDPFPLMESIITKIFWKEEDAINEPFLRILQDSKEILQASPD
ncbi:hypothetical protein C2G38_2179610 [Gigaspora rosea]|uniref:Uncharacterized protein n=1 Tax=Gigaspora rosea TaxID=44941 RepID=A0A397VH36_9GLOM|nr:hypothetical protein C2G38_2179610 [Gigaspora rosea]